MGNLKEEFGMSKRSEGGVDLKDLRSRPMDRSGGAARDSREERDGMDPVSRVALLSLLVNLCLVGIKLLLSEISGSLALRADAVHSVVDVFGSTALILGIFI